VGKWDMVRLGDVCEILNGFAFKSNNYVDSGYRVIRITNVQKGVIVDDDPKYYTASQTLDKYKLHDKDLLISLTGNVGRVGLIREDLLPAYLNQRVACLREKNPALSKEFLFSFLNFDNFERAAISSSKGLAQKNMSTEWLKDYEIPLPPLEAQQQIADALDRASALIEKRKTQIEKLDLLVRSQFIEMFGDPVTNPKGWPVRKLKEIALAIQSGNTPKGGKQVYVDSGIMFFRSQNVWRNKIELSDIAYIEEKTHKKMSQTRLKNKDILITKTGRFNTENSSLGRAALFLGDDDSANINGHVYLVRLDENSAHEFILYILITDEYRDYIRKVCVGGIDKRQINKEHIEEFPIIMPPTELQCQFSDFFLQVQTQKYLLQKSLQKLEINYKSLMQKCFNGEIF